MSDQEHLGNHPGERVPRGICPLCRSQIGTSRAGKFECPNCHRPIQTTTAYRALCQIVSFGVAAGICWLSGWTWLVKILAWPALAFVIGVLYYTAAAFVWMPSYVEFHPRRKRHGRNDDEPFQKLNLDK
jgi:hypothetical protein